ncbi:MAG: 2-C-methyl-D-erythritol 4-phosphate cytidylyltransferase [Acidobacteriota bacterium]
MKRVAAIIVAAGEGRRFGAAKQFLTLKGKPVVDWSIAALAAHPEVDEVILVLPDDSQQEHYFSLYKKVSAVAAGGPRRQDSVARGFERLNAAQTAVVLVHDGVRPVLSADLIGRVIAEARRSGAAIPALPVEETIKEVEEGAVLRTVERERLFRVQTPQGFSYEVLAQALKQAAADRFYGTDEAGLVERTGHRIAVVEGDPRNIKVTAPADLKIAEVLLEG